MTRWRNFSRLSLLDREKFAAIILGSMRVGASPLPLWKQFILKRPTWRESEIGILLYFIFLCLSNLSACSLSLAELREKGRKKEDLASLKQGWWILFRLELKLKLECHLTDGLANLLDQDLGVPTWITVPLPISIPELLINSIQFGLVQFSSDRHFKLAPKRMNLNGHLNGFSHCQTYGIWIRSRMICRLSLAALID